MQNGPLWRFNGGHLPLGHVTRTLCGRVACNLQLYDLCETHMIISRSYYLRFSRHNFSQCLSGKIQFKRCVSYLLALINTNLIHRFIILDYLFSQNFLEKKVNKQSCYLFFFFNPVLLYPGAQLLYSLKNSFVDRINKHLNHGVLHASHNNFFQLFLCIQKFPRLSITNESYAFFPPRCFFFSLYLSFLS